MLTILLIGLSIWILMGLYVFYQLARNKKIYKIRTHWRRKYDPRIEMYSYEYMFNPSFKNWLGFKFPNENDFS